MKITHALAFFIISIQLKALATETDAQQWFNLTAQGVVSQEIPIGLYFEAQSRRSGDRDEIYESLIRPAIYYKSENYGAFFLGTLSRLNQDQRQVETRHWVQWLAQPEIGGSDYVHIFRARLEQRDFENDAETSNRMRIMVRTLHTSILSSQIRPFGSLELFYHLNSASANLPAGLAQSRAAIGLSAPLGKITTFELSYLNMFLFNRQDEDQMNHVLNIAFNLNF